MLIFNYYLFYFSSGLVPLHNACSYGHYEVTELLLKVSGGMQEYLFHFSYLGKMWSIHMIVKRRGSLSVKYPNFYARD